MALSKNDVLNLVAQPIGPPPSAPGESSTAQARLIEPFEPDHMGPCSYDLAIGDEFYCYEDDDGERFVSRALVPGGSIHIPPNRCAFILSKEKINMPTDLMGMVALRFGLTKQGIMLSPQAPIDPGYCGKILMMLYNLSDEMRTLRRGERFVTVSFHRVETPTSPYTGPNQGITELIGFFPQATRRPVKTSLTKTEEMLAAKAEQLEQQMRQIQEQRAKILTTVMGVAVIVLAAAALLAALIPLTLTLLDRGGGEDLDPSPSPSPSQSVGPTSPHVPNASNTR